MSLPFSLLACLFTSLAAAEFIDKSLLWGPYRPNLYFGIRPRIPTGPIFSLMWGSVENGKLNPQKLRHTCEQGDGINSYGWTTYDARNGGVQTISDPENALNLTIEFIKFPFAFPSALDDWSVRVKGTPFVGVENWNMSVIFHLGIEEQDNVKEPNIRCSSSVNGTVGCQGDATRLGEYSILLPPPQSRGALSTTLKSTTAAKDRIWEAKSFLLDDKIWPSTFPQAQGNSGNLHYVQRQFESSFSMNIHFRPGYAAKELSDGTLNVHAYYAKSKFEREFNAVFQPSQRWLEKGDIKFSQSLLSNLMGGIGYFYGDDRINNSRTSSTQPPSSDTHELFTMVPSRSFFPRDFLWHEGFHLLVVINWDLDLALEILQNWFALMNEDGWIAREQILGPEARSKVPEEFQLQDRDYANPPTLFLVVETFLDMVSGRKDYHGATTKQLDHQFATSFLVQLYPKLKKYYEWWNKTQGEDSTHLSYGGHVHHGYRWKGQTATHILTSGLDDYPRTNPPGPHDLHVDALSWVGLMANVLRKTADYLEEHQDSAIFRKQKKDVDSSMEFWHWSEDDRAYCDTTKVDGLSVHECHKGYVSLLPFLVGSWNASHPHLDATLNLMRDESHLWSPYGLRSLSLTNRFYGTDENYWRGPIWININYLAIVKLLELSKTYGPHQTLARSMYIQLRNNIISTVYNSWQSTGSVWEQYSPSTGAGQRTQGFTGWTALVVNILAMPDLTYTVPQEAPKPFKFGDLLNTIMGGIFMMGFFFMVFFILFGIPICMAYYERNKRRVPPGYTGLVRVRRVNTNYLPWRLLRMGQATRSLL